MKKQTLLLAAGGMLLFAACSSNDSKSNNSQALIDSLANVKAAQMQAQMAAQNDSTIKAIAKAKADSVMAFEKGKEAGMEAEKSKMHHHHGDHDNGNNYQDAPPPPDQPATVGNGKPSMTGNQNSNTIGNGKPKM